MGERYLLGSTHYGAQYREDAEGQGGPSVAYYYGAQYREDEEGQEAILRLGLGLGLGLGAHSMGRIRKDRKP